jgi:hypothetical protein
MPDEFEVEFWLPNHADAQAEMVSAPLASGCARIGDELYELVRLFPSYPAGLDGPTVRVRAAFRRRPSASFIVSFDALFRGAFSPWPRGR